MNFESHPAAAFSGLMEILNVRGGVAYPQASNDCWHEALEEGVTKV